jgi:hypothetical protein
MALKYAGTVVMLVGFTGKIRYQSKERLSAKRSIGKNLIRLLQRKWFFIVFLSPFVNNLFLCVSPVFLRFFLDSRAGRVYDY